MIRWFEAKAENYENNRNYDYFHNQYSDLIYGHQTTIYDIRDFI